MPIPSGQLVTPVGQRADGTMRSLLIDSDDRLVIADNLAAGDTLWSEEESISTTPAGTVVLDHTAVPSGELHHLQTIAAINQTSAITRIQFEARVSGIYCIFHTLVAPAVSTWLTWTGKITLAEGDNLRISFVGCNINDSILSRSSAVVASLPS